GSGGRSRRPGRKLPAPLRCGAIRVARTQRSSMIRIRPMVEEDLRLIRAWMNDNAGAPAWSEDDLTAVVKAPSPDQRRLRRGWVAEQTGSGAAGFAVATGLSIPGAPAECELEFVLVRLQVRRSGIGGMLVHAALNWGRD